MALTNIVTYQSNALSTKCRMKTPKAFHVFYSYIVVNLWLGLEYITHAVVVFDGFSLHQFEFVHKHCLAIIVAICYDIMQAR